MTPSECEVVTYADEYQKAFFELNRDWINQNAWQLEASDYEVLGDPRKYIIERGGEVYVGLIRGEVLGVCALRKVDDATYELAKLAVSPRAQGHGLGAALCRAVVEGARERGGRKVIIETNSRLLPAVHIYEKLGFRAIDTSGKSVHYARVDLVMEKEL